VENLLLSHIFFITVLHQGFFSFMCLGVSSGSLFIYGKLLSCCNLYFCKIGQVLKINIILNNFKLTQGCHTIADFVFLNVIFRLCVSVLCSLQDCNREFLKHNIGH
jgi:hypothetical protein